MNLQSAVKTVQSQTNENDHTGAIVTMAKFVVNKHNQLEDVESLVKAAQAVKTLHTFYGHMPSHLNRIRDEVAARCESFMTADEQKVFHDAR